MLKIQYFTIFIISIFIIISCGSEATDNTEEEDGVSGIPDLDSIRNTYGYMDEDTSAYRYSVRPTTYNPDSVVKVLKPNKDGIYPIDWLVLKDTDIEEKYSEELENFFWYFHFGPLLKHLEDKKVYIKGYVLALEADYYVLSANPLSMCFFCGNAGPESILRIKLKDTEKRFKTDEFLTFKGKLRLNAEVIEELNYILEDAEVYDVD